MVAFYFYNEERDTPAETMELTEHRSNHKRDTPTETTKLKEHRSNHVRPESHDTSTNISDLHKVGKEQPSVTPRDTKQPSENDVSPPGTATSDLHKVEGTQAEPPCISDMHDIRELHTLVPPRMAPRNELQKQQLGAYTRHLDRTRRMEATIHCPRGQLTKPKEERHG
ncbi:hypothetical protein Taro_055690 [Colocasia esculenta]|uniref:Uncharacterized protein n=1 Tax=Colocasia esculenta TaxID=4460 RepID=A0A843XV09_COLES|nr:hypothetical protein [Colocasia esculenta]